MFARNVAATGLRAARTARQPTTLARRQMSAASAAPAKKVEQGAAELWPFAKSESDSSIALTADVPVDVYPLLFLVSVVSAGSLYMCARHRESPPFAAADCSHDRQVAPPQALGHLLDMTPDEPLCICIPMNRV